MNLLRQVIAYFVRTFNVVAYFEQGDTVHCEANSRSVPPKHVLDQSNVSSGAALTGTVVLEHFNVHIIGDSEMPHKVHKNVLNVENHLVRLAPSTPEVHLGVKGRDAQEGDPTPRRTRVRKVGCPEDVKELPISIYCSGIVVQWRNRPHVSVDDCDSDNADLSSKQVLLRNCDLQVGTSIVREFHNPGEISTVMYYVGYRADP